MTCSENFHTSVLKKERYNTILFFSGVRCDFLIGKSFQDYWLGKVLLHGWVECI